MNSTAQTAHVGVEIISDTGDACGKKIINETAYTGEAWIRQRKEPCGL
jgi:hypothetical protein